MAAAAAAKVVRGGRSCFSSRLLGSKGQVSEGASFKAPERMEQLCSKRSLHVEPKREPKQEREPMHPISIAFLAATGLGVLCTLPANYRGVKGCMKVYKF